MDNKDMIMETVNTAAQEVVKKTDHTGAIFVGIGFVGGLTITAAAIYGAKKIKKAHAAKKAAPQVVVATADVK